MTVAELRLYSYGIDRTRGDIPIFATAAAETAAGGGSGVTAPSLTFSSVKVRRDPYPQTIEVSLDASSMGTLELCDTAVIRISSVDRWYFITGYEEITNSAYPNSSNNRMSVQISLEYIPITTGLSLASTVDLIPERMPSATPRIMQTWSQSVMMQATPTTVIPGLNKLPSIKHTGQDTPALWCEVSYKTTSALARIGFFIAARLYTNTTGDFEDPHKVRYSADVGTTTYMFPSLDDIFYGTLMTNAGISSTMSDIIDINISEFCPFAVEKVNIDSNFDTLRIIANNGSQINATHHSPSSSEHYYYYHLTDSEAFNTTNPYIRKPNITTITLKPSDFERHNGRYVLKDSEWNTIMVIPGDLMESTMTIDCFTYSDASGIYSYFRYKGVSCTITSNKIPWTGSQWEYYRAYTMQYDRQALQNNIDMANKDMELALIDSAATGIVGGVIGGAVAGGGLTGAAVGGATGISSFASSAINANLKREQQINKLQREQDLTEQRMKNQPSSANNTSYGAGYVMRLAMFPGAQFILEMPADFTETEFTAQTGIWGYPSNKVKQSNVALTTGYWKGRILNFTNTINNTSAGELSDLMVRQFDDGVRLKQVS